MSTIQICNFSGKVFDTKCANIILLYQYTLFVGQFHTYALSVYEEEHVRDQTLCGAPMGISSQSIIQLSEFRMHVSDGSMYLSTRRYPFIPCNTDILELLHLFSSPTTLGEAVAHPSSSQDWIRRTSAILGLIDAGVLETRDRHSKPPAIGLEQLGFGSAREHIAMLNDRGRTEAYLNAIANSVKPGDVVIDLGAGTGILSAAAARCGAGKVHAIERTPIAEAAQALFEANGLQERIVVHREPSTNVELSEPADVLVTELVGNEPLSERILEYVLDARNRLLKPGARIIPYKLEIAAQCLQLGAGMREQYQFTSANTAEWSSAYGLDFSTLLEQRPARSLKVEFSPTVLARCKPVGPGAPLHSFELARYTSPQVETSTGLPVDRPGPVDAIHLSFKLHLDKEHHIDSSYDAIHPNSSWGCPVWLCDEPVPADEGDVLSVTYRHNPLGSRLDVGAGRSGSR